MERVPTEAESVAGSRLRKAKGLAGGIAGFLVVLAMLAIVGVIFGATEVLSEWLLPWLLDASLAAFAVMIVVLIPISLSRRYRVRMAMAILYLSLLYGTTLWMSGLVLTVSLWGAGAAIFGLLLMGVGVVPMAMLATLFHRSWGLLAELVGLTVLTFGSRALAFWLEGSANQIVQSDLRKSQHLDAVASEALKPSDSALDHAASMRHLQLGHRPRSDGASASSGPRELPDLGKYLADRGTPQKTLLLYLTWKMEALQVLGPDKYRTVIVQDSKGELYLAVFDFDLTVLEDLMEAATRRTKDFITERITKDPFSIRGFALPDPISVGIGAVLADRERGNQQFVPLQVVEVIGGRRAKWAPEQPKPVSQS